LNLDFSPRELLKHFNIFGPLADNEPATLQSEISNNQAEEPVTTIPVDMENNRAVDGEGVGTTTTDSNITTEVTTIEAVDMGWDTTPGHYPVLLPSNTLLRTKSWYYIDENGTLTSTLDYSHKLNIQGDIIHENESKKNTGTQTDIYTNDQGIQAATTSATTETQTERLTTENATQTTTSTKDKAIQNTPLMQNTQTQCNNLDTPNIEKQDKETITDKMIRIPMNVTLNMGDAEDRPRWEWP
jgi:hypothetical protein